MQMSDKRRKRGLPIALSDCRKTKHKAKKGHSDTIQSRTSRMSVSAGAEDVTSLQLKELLKKTQSVFRLIKTR